MDKQKNRADRITISIVASLLLSLLLFSSCNIKFNKAKWLQSDPAFPPEDRKIMLHDLVTNYKLIGLRTSELENLLGEPNFIDSTSSTLIYNIELHYDMIDPDYSKDLEFTLTKDSTVKSFKVTEWKK